VEGIQVEPGDLMADGFWAVNKVDNQLGKIDCAVTLLNPASPINGSGLLAIIHVKSLSEGTVSIHIDSATLATRDAVSIPVTWQNAEVKAAAAGKEAQPTSVAISSNPAAIPTSETSQPASTDLSLYLSAGLGVILFLAALIMFILVLRKRR
jgi:hypothetical protein